MKNTDDINKLPSSCLGNMGKPTETHLKLNSRETSFFHNVSFGCHLVFKVCTKHNRITAVLYGKCQKPLRSWVISYEQARFHEIWVQKSFGRLSYIYLSYIFYIAQPPVPTTNEKHVHLSMYVLFASWKYVVSSCFSAKKSNAARRLVFDKNYL